MTNYDYIAELVIDELNGASEIRAEAIRDLLEERASQETYAYYHNGQTEGVY